MNNYEKTHFYSVPLLKPKYFIKQNCCFLPISECPFITSDEMWSCSQMLVHLWFSLSRKYIATLVSVWLYNTNTANYPEGERQIVLVTNLQIRSELWEISEAHTDRVMACTKSKGMDKTITAQTIFMQVVTSTLGHNWNKSTYSTSYLVKIIVTRFILKARTSAQIVMTPTKYIWIVKMCTQTQQKNSLMLYMSHWIDKVYAMCKHNKDFKSSK